MVAYVKANPHPYLDDLGARGFIDRERELHAETAQLALTFIWKLVIGAPIRIILIVLSVVNLQFQGQVCSISLRPVLGTVAVYIMATV